MPPRFTAALTPESSWRDVTYGMSESCERVFDVARAFAMGRGSDLVRVEHFVWSLFNNGRHASTASFLQFAADIDVPKLHRLVQANCHVISQLPPAEIKLTPKLLVAVSVARSVCLAEERREDDDEEPRLAAQSILAVLLLDEQNFAARSLREALPGQRGERGPGFQRVRSSLLANFMFTNDALIGACKRELECARDGRPDEPDAPEEYTCPISGEVMDDPVQTAMGQSYERANIERWLRDHATDPLTNQRMHSTRVTPNHALKSLIGKWRDDKSAKEAAAPAPPTPAMDFDTPSTR